MAETDGKTKTQENVDVRMRPARCQEKDRCAGCTWENDRKK